MDSKTIMIYGRRDLANLLEKKADEGNKMKIDAVQSGMFVEALGQVLADMNPIERWASLDRLVSEELKRRASPPDKIASVE